MKMPQFFLVDKKLKIAGYYKDEYDCLSLSAAYGSYTAGRNYQEWKWNYV